MAFSFLIFLLYSFLLSLVVFLIFSNSSFNIESKRASRRFISFIASLSPLFANFLTQLDGVKKTLSSIYSLKSYIGYFLQVFKNSSNPKLLLQVLNSFISMYVSLSFSLSLHAFSSSFIISNLYKTFAFSFVSLSFLIYSLVFTIDFL